MGLKLVNGSVKKSAVIFDIDGTITDCSHRLHHLQAAGKYDAKGQIKNYGPDWEGFYAGIEHDTAKGWAQFLARCLYGHADLILLTGRPEKTRLDTCAWLKRHQFPFTASLFMREDDNHEPDSQLKARIYEEEIEPYYHVIFVVEDRASVVEMWRGLGLTCLQCAKGNF